MDRGERKDKQQVARQDKPLRRGWTTGACAAAAAKAAYSALLCGDFPDPVPINLPGGKTTSFSLSKEALYENRAMAAIVKDAGDDPDVTHGALIIVAVSPGKPGSGLCYVAGEGVGTVTRPGLSLSVGEPAINPAPRQMIRDELIQLAERYAVELDVVVEISVPDGEKLAEKTMNGRLGIIGGISILGTTGIVVPYSCSAWIASIHQAVDVARAEGTRHMGASTGNTSEKALARATGLAKNELIEMGDFAGGLLKYLRRNPLDRLTIAGGFAKMTKLAAGHMDLHSARSSVDFQQLKGLLGELKAPEELVAACDRANTAAEILDLARQAEIPLADLVAMRAQAIAQDICDRRSKIDILVTDRAGNIVGSAHD